MTIVSGHYEAHLHLGELVLAHGWPKVRRGVHAAIEPDHPSPPESQLELFEGS